MSAHTTDEQIVAALTDAQALLCTLYGEGRGESVNGRVAIGAVIRNRVRLGKWGSTYKSVCLAPWQFSCWKAAGGAENHTVVMRLARQLAEGDAGAITPLVAETRYLADGIIEGVLLDPTRGAINYHATSMVGLPTWAATMKLTVRIDGHLFYRALA
jgi:N-acetylmuramoyl-L-alanine amidase